MNVCLTQQQKNEFVKRGFSRRNFGRLAAMITAGATLPFFNEPAMAQLSAIRGPMPPDAVKINANENPLGPCEDALAAIHKVAKDGGRYLYEETFGFQELLAEQEGVKANYVQPYAGSSAPLHQAVLGFTSPTKPFVTADPGYEAPERAAEFIGTKVIRVPLTEDFRARCEGDGGGQSGCRVDLRVQPEQSDRDADAEVRDRVAAGEQAQGQHPAAGRSLHTHRGSADVLGPGGAGQGHRHPANVLQDLRHGGTARGRGDRASRPAGEDPAVDVGSAAGHRDGGGDGQPEIEDAGAGAAQDHRRRAQGRARVPRQARVPVHPLGIEQVHGEREAARARRSSKP